MKLTILTLTITVCQCCDPINWITQSFIDEINDNAPHWTAAHTCFGTFNTTQLSTLASLRGYHPDPLFTPPLRKYKNIKKKEIPDSFDARLRWPECPSIYSVQNQGYCGACWAFAAAEVMTDRLCIKSEGSIQFTFSTEELISCCSVCGRGCTGGYLFPAFEYWNYKGIPSGGGEYKEQLNNEIEPLFENSNRRKKEVGFSMQKKYAEIPSYNSVVNELSKLTKADLIEIIITKAVPDAINVSTSVKEVVENSEHKYDIKYQGCRPFTAMRGSTPRCQQMCQPGYNKSWEQDLRHGIAAYHVDMDPAQIQLEIMLHGPVAATMDVYKDFFVYNQGVYEHVSWDLIGRHAVKIIGWGLENEVPYWLVVNSWGSCFGMNGLVKILRGNNHCGIEYEVTAGIPNVYE